MSLGKKIRLIPTEKQIIGLKKSCGTARFIYNFTIKTQEENYLKGNKFLNDGEIRKMVTVLKHTKEYEWLNEVSNNVSKQAVKDACNAYISFFKGLTDKPVLKKKGKCKESFYNDDYKLKIKENMVLIEKVGWIRIKPNQLDIDKHYINPRVSYDGKYWYLSVGARVSVPDNQLTDEVIGIDLGIKKLATCSNGYIVPNINKTSRVKELEKRKKRLDRKISKKFEKNKKGKEYIKTKNIEKSLKLKKLIERKLKNIRLNQIHQATSTIVKTKPCRIVMEDLDIEQMKKNKFLSHLLQNMPLYQFKIILKYKCELNGIEFREVDKYYASSKICSCCGNRKTILPLSTRVYYCDKCNTTMDRDLNASINLRNYQFI